MKKKVLFFLSIFLTFPLNNNVGLGKMTVISTDLVNTKENITPVKFELINEATIHKTWGHAHSPFGVHGQNEYEYEGGIKISGRVVKIKTEMEPIAAFLINNRHFLLTSYYFNKKLFKWYESNGRDFLQLEFGDLNKELFEIEFADHDDTLLYRMWLLNNCLNNNIERTHELLSKFVADNPRFAYKQEWLPRKQAVFCDFVSNLIDKVKTYPKKDLFFNVFGVVLRNSQPQDDPQDIRFICLLLLEIDSKKATKLITEYISRIEKENVKEDNRLLDMESIREILEKERAGGKRSFNICYSPNLLKRQDFCDRQTKPLLDLPIFRMEILARHL